MTALKWRFPVEKNGIKRISQIRDIPSDFDGSFNFALLDIDCPVFTAVLLSLDSTLGLHAEQRTKKAIRKSVYPSCLRTDEIKTFVCKQQRIQ